MPVRKTDVTAVLQALQDHTIDIVEASQRFRALHWQPQERDAPAPTTAQELLGAAENDDPPVATPGSFDEVSVAYAIGQISDAEYGALFAAWKEAVGA